MNNIHINKGFSILVWKQICVKRGGLSAEMMQKQEKTKDTCGLTTPMSMNSSRVKHENEKSNWIHRQKRGMCVYWNVGRWKGE